MDEYIKKQDAIKAACRGFCHPGVLCPDELPCREQTKYLRELSPADVIPIKWIQKKIDKSIGMEHAMWSKLIRMWENEQLRKYVRNLKDDNK